jgi:adenylate kinase family enzyme
MGSGKSSIAKYIYNRYNIVHYRSIGNKIHSECALHGNETREEMQQYGQMMRKIFGENVWCNYLYNGCPEKDRIIIDDGRQLNEYDYFTNKGFIPIAVISDKQTRLERLSQRVNYIINPETFNHETEIQAQECINKCSIKLYNNADKKELFEQFDKEIKNYWLTKGDI